MEARRLALPVAVLLAAILSVAMLTTGCGHETQPTATSAGDGEATQDGTPAAEAQQPSPEPEAMAPRSFGARVWTSVKIVAILLGKVIFVIALPAAVAATLLGMPGSVLVLAAATIYSAFHGWASPPWWVLLILVAIAVLAEVAESALSFAGVKRSGAGNASGLWVLGGGFAGAILGAAIASALSTIGALAGPVGWIVLAVVPPLGLGMVGGYLAGYWYELRQGRSPEEARKAGWGALAGRVAGSFTKALLVAVMASVVMIASWGTLF